MDAIVLAGGRGSRLGGVDKAALVVAGTSLLERALGAVAGADRVVVVGPPTATSRPVVWAREEPPGGGPAAALEAGLAEVASDLVVVIAVDMPLLRSSDVDALHASVGARDGAMFVDRDGRDQPLAAVYRTIALKRALRSLPGAEGARMSSLAAALDLVRIPGASASFDCDEPSDVDEAEAVLRER